MEEKTSPQPQFPDIQRERVLQALKSKEWACCKKCDWFYKTSVLEKCPMCRHPWRVSISYNQPPFESSSLS